MSNCTPVIFSAVHAFFEDQGRSERFFAFVPKPTPALAKYAGVVEVRILLGPGGEYACVFYLVSVENPSTYEVTVAYEVQDMPKNAGVGMSREQARVFHADVALVEKMLEYVDGRVLAASAEEVSRG